MCVRETERERDVDRERGEREERMRVGSRARLLSSRRQECIASHIKPS
jgi:hypothetical protein